MTQETKYLGRKEVRAQLEGLIAATNYARDPKYNCLNCMPCSYQLSSVGARGAHDEEYRGVVTAVENLGVTKEEVNLQLKDVLGSEIFQHHGFGGCFEPDSLCEVVAGIMDKKGLLK